MFIYFALVIASVLNAYLAIKLVQTQKKLKVQSNQTNSNIADIRVQTKLKTVQKIATVGSWEFDLQTGEISWSEEMYQIAGFDPTKPPPNYEQLLANVHPEDRTAFASVVEKAIATGTFYETNLRIFRPDGTLRLINSRGEALTNETGEVIMILGAVVDLTERKHSKAELKSIEKNLANQIEVRTRSLRHEIDTRHQVEQTLSKRLQQQAVVAQLGEIALNSSNLDTLFQQATTLVAQALEVEYCKVLELVDNDQALLLRSGVGWQAGLVGRAKVGIDLDSQAGYTLQSAEPIVVEDLKQEKRFSGPPLLNQHGVVSGISTIISGKIEPFGILGAHTTQKRAFSRDDVNFLQSVANILAAAAERTATKKVLQREEARLQRLFQSNMIGIGYWHRDGSITEANEALLKILGLSEQELQANQINWRDITPSEYQDVDKQALAEIEVSGSCTPFEKEFFRRDGSRVPTLVGACGMTSDRHSGFFFVLDITRRKHSETLLQGQNQILKMIARDLELPEILAALTSLIESLFSKATCVIGLFEPDKTALTYVAAPSLPPEISNSLTELVIDAKTNRPHQEPVIISDLAQEPFWTAKSNLALPKELRACWCFPIYNSAKEILGTLVLCHPTSRQPNDSEWASIERLSSLIVIAIESKQAKQTIKDSGQRFRNTFEQAAVGIAHVAPDGTWLRVNQRLCEIVGYTPQEMLQKTFQDITHPDDLDLDLEYIRQILAGKITKYTLAKRYLRQDETVVWVNLTVSLVREETGEPKYFISVVEDISTRKQLEKALQQSVEHLQVLHQLDKAILELQRPKAIAKMLVDCLQQLLPSTQTTILTFDYEAQTANFLSPPRQKPTASIGTQLRLDSIKPLIEELETSNSYIIGDLSLFDQSEQLISNLRTEELNCFVGFPLRVQNQLLGVLQIWLDHPEVLRAEQLNLARELSNQGAIAINQARLYQQIQRANQQLEKRVAARTAQLQDMNKELEAFTYTISHDLRAPLRALEGFTTALLEDYGDSLDELGYEYARRLVAAAKNMEQLIQDLLAYSRLSRTNLQLHSVNLAAIVAEVIDQLQIEIDAKQAQIRIEKPLPQVIGNQTVLFQVISNLLSNALKFTAPEVQPYIKISSEKRGNWVRLWIEDNGIGISPEHYQQIFQVFERLHGSETYPGTGIGLAIVHKAIERLGGKVGLESTPGVGSRFWLEMRRADSQN